jgi:hypothetical protein
VNRLALGFGIAALLGLGLWLGNGLHDQAAEAPERPGSASGPRGGLQPRPVPTDPALAQVDAAASAVLPASGLVRQALSAEFSRRFLDAENYRQFVKEALDAPANGGYYYAVQAHLHCIQFSTTARLFGDSAGQPLTPERQRALERVRDTVRRCEHLAAQFGGELEITRRAMRRPAGQASPDPLMRISEAAAQVGEADAAATRELWALAKGSGDPLLVREYLQRPWMPALIGLPLFDPDNLVDRKLAIHAAHMAGCELVGDCTKSALAVNGCLMADTCHVLDLREQIRASVPENHRAKLDAFANAFRAAVR